MDFQRAGSWYLDKQVGTDVMRVPPFCFDLDFDLVAIALEDQFLDVIAELTGNFDLVTRPAFHLDHAGNVGNRHGAIGGSINGLVDFLGRNCGSAEDAQVHKCKSSHHLSL